MIECFQEFHVPARAGFSCETFNVKYASGAASRFDHSKALTRNTERAIQEYHPGISSENAFSSLSWEGTFFLPYRWLHPTCFTSFPVGGLHPCLVTHWRQQATQRISEVTLLHVVVCLGSFEKEYMRENLSLKAEWQAILFPEPSFLIALLMPTNTRWCLQTCTKSAKMHSLQKYLSR